MNLDVASIGLSALRRVTDLISAGKADSLIDYTNPARVEPICVIDADLLYYEGLSQVQQSLLSIFSGYYLQAIALSATIGSVSVVKHLDKLNPKRNPSDSALNTVGTGEYAGGLVFATEDFKWRLPVFGDTKRIALEQQVALESAKEPKDAKTTREKSSQFGIGRDTVSQLRELADLSVGKLLSVELTDGLHKATIPVSVRLMASSLPSNSLVHILSHGSEDTTVKERYHAWRAGRLSFIKDLVLCQDLIDAHRKNLMADKDGLYSTILRRHRSNQLSAIVSGNPSVATASNITVMSSDTAAQVELKVNGRLKDARVRDKIFKNTYMMIMAVVDKQWERVTFYHRGIAMPTEVGVKDLKAANKGSGPDVSDILRAYSLGQAPSL
jgi:hypothetical protein